jgi:hypothetical protein
MSPFEEFRSNVDSLPIKARIQWFIDRAAEAGITIDRRQAKRLVNERKAQRTFQNDTYTVLLQEGREVDRFISPGARESLAGQCAYLSIRRNDRGADIPWADKQAIKDALCGEEREALEIYPARSRLVDAANQYHLFVMPEGGQVPFGFGYPED